MSEYQYYEFRAIDQPLDKKAMGELRAITSRAEITPRRLINVYHFGDFKGNPDRLMDKYFDAFLYVANWGTRRLALRLPRQSIDKKHASEFKAGDCVSVRATADHVIVDFEVNEESDCLDHEEGDGRLEDLLPLRQEIMAGDFRPLYLGWLAAMHEIDDVGQAGWDGRSQPPKKSLPNFSALTRS